MNEAVRVTAEQIRKLQVQGARNVAIAAIKAFQALAETTHAATRKDFLAELGDARTLLFMSRETEPLMRNAVRWIITRVEDSDERKVAELAHVVCVSSENFQKSLAASKERIAEIGSKRILEGSTIFTHCHSSTATHMLWKAKDEGKSFQVICTETRPPFKGGLRRRRCWRWG